MNYEERYNELIDAIKVMMEANPHDEGLQNWVQDNVPELKESEDERIRKALIRFHKGTIDIDGIKGDEIVSWLEKQCEPVDKGEISDGFHTFNELYYYRMLYNAAFFNMLPKEWVHKSKKHNDGEECFGGGWFIVMANLPTGQISNHYELKNWDLFQIPEKERADKWDGHTPQEAAERLHKFLLEKQGEQKSGWSEEDDLVEELDYDDYIRFFNEHPGCNNDSWGFDEAWKFAQYFYKLGLKAKKGGEG